MTTHSLAFGSTVASIALSTQGAETQSMELGNFSVSLAVKDIRAARRP